MGPMLTALYGGSSGQGQGPMEDGGDDDKMVFVTHTMLCATSKYLQYFLSLIIVLTFPTEIENKLKNILRRESCYTWQQFRVG